MFYTGPLFFAPQITQTPSNRINIGALRNIQRRATGVATNRFEGADSWDLMELVDWQFLDASGKQWKPWALEGFGIGLSLLAKLNELEVLADIIAQETPHGPEVVDTYVRLVAAQKVNEVEIDYKQVDLIVDLIVSQTTLGSEAANEEIRDLMIGALRGAGASERRRAADLLRKTHSRAERSKDKEVAAWAAKAARALGRRR